MCLLLSSGRTVSASTYLIGLGSYDITGPAADVNMMGYANTEQTTSIIQLPLRCGIRILHLTHDSIASMMTNE